MVSGLWQESPSWRTQPAVPSESLESAKQLYVVSYVRRLLLILILLTPTALLAKGGHGHGHGHGHGKHTKVKRAQVSVVQPNENIASAPIPDGNGRALASPGIVNPLTEHVSGYTTSTGKVVNSYYRTAPNHTRNDNFSTKGNTNPFTGAKGSKAPDPN